MDDFKVVTDLLASVASVVAIVTVLWSWFKISQRPLVIERVVILKKNAENTYILVLRNRKSYPVEIRSTNCYSKPYYKVKQKKNQGPEYSALLSFSDSLFVNSDKFEISASGHTEISISGNKYEGELSKLLFSIQSSHGYHKIWCKKIHVEDMTGNIEFHEVDHLYEFDSKVKAKLKYY